MPFEIVESAAEPAAMRRGTETCVSGAPLAVADGTMKYVA